jgi:exodeoxyribonuclease VII large subunit
MREAAGRFKSGGRSWSKKKMTNRSPAKPDTVYSVSQVTEIIKLTLENALAVLWVEGEISNFHRHTSGHLYFTLKDPKSQLRAVMFRFEAKKIAFEAKDGLSVVCRGRINVYEPRGEYQIVCDVMEPKGKGALQLAFEQLKEKLRAEGLFDPKHKKKLPLRPKTIGIVTSPRGAAIADILRILERRYARLHVLLYPAQVQGEGAAATIVEGIEYLGSRPGVDVIIVGRGGGSIEDLWAFNEEVVARAIFRCPVPVVSAVGHEVDFTIADFVADIRASTPSAAAEMVIEKEQAFEERIANLSQRAAQSLKYELQKRKAGIETLTSHRIFQNFRVRVLSLGQRVDELEMRAWKVLRAEKQTLSEKKAFVYLSEERIRNRTREKIAALRGRWEILSSQLHALSPLNILKKGYSLCWKEEGFRLVRAPREVAQGERVIVSFARGEITCEVRDIDEARTPESRLIKETS